MTEISAPPYRVAQKCTVFVERLNFVKYELIFKILSLSESLKIPSHLKCVATLPCKMLVS